MTSAINFLVQNAVKRACKAGDLEDLPGAGRPLKPSSLTTDPFAHVYAESGAILPPSTMRGRITEARAELRTTADPRARRALETKIALLETQLAIEGETFRCYT